MASFDSGDPRALRFSLDHLSTAYHAGKHADVYLHIAQQHRALDNFERAYTAHLKDCGFTWKQIGQLAGITTAQGTFQRFKRLSTK